MATRVKFEAGAFPVKLTVTDPNLAVVAETENVRRRSGILTALVAAVDVAKFEG
jgi:hypothetical protein